MSAVRKILIIEDDPVVGTGYQRFLQIHGFESELASDGLIGLQRVAVFQPDAVILDLLMPRLGGIDVIKRLRAQEAYQELPVLVLTNACILAYIDQAKEAGASHILDKSKDSPSAMLGVLQALLDRGSKPA